MSWLSIFSGRAKDGAGGVSAPQKDRAGPPRIVIDHHEYSPEEFVMGSFRIRPYDGDLIAKQQFDFKIVFQLAGDSIEFACRGTVVKQDGQVGLVARYQKPQPFYERKLIDYLRLQQGA